MNMVPGQPMIYRSTDKVINKTSEINFPTEYLNQVKNPMEKYFLPVDNRITIVNVYFSFAGYFVWYAWSPNSVEEG